MHFSGEEQKGIKGEKLLSFRASAKSGEVLLAPAPKFEEQGLLLSKERRLVQVCRSPGLIRSNDCLDWAV